MRGIFLFFDFLLLFESDFSFSFGRFFSFDFFFVLTGDDTSTYWNLATDNYVFLETIEVVNTTRDGSVDKHTSGVLEGCSREEGI